jgi:hypothetical protein
LPGYQTFPVVAAGLQTEPETLLDFHRKGWIQAVERGDVLYLAADQRYRAKYILHLYNAKNLNEEQIELVLSIQRPPYSAAQVDEILKNHSTAPSLNNTGG